MLDEVRAKNIIAKSLGAFWIVDGLLQFQPQMFGATFVNQVLVPSLSNQPSFIHAIVAFGIALWNVNPPLMDTLAALLQIGIGVLLLFPLPSKRFKAGAYISIVWGVIVWLCGEGMGLLLTGGASFYTGAPGAVVAYVLLAILLLIPEKVVTKSYAKILGWVFILTSLLQLQPSLWTTDGAQGNFMTSMMDPVHFLSILPNYIYNATGLNPVLANLLLLIILLGLGVSLVLNPDRLIGTVILVFLFFVWWLGQDFGQLSTLIVGTPTDPNTAPLLALLLIPLFLKREEITS